MGPSAHFYDVGQHRQGELSTLLRPEGTRQATLGAVPNPGYDDRPHRLRAQHSVFSLRNAFLVG
jgi:hypothetical protein